MQTLFKWIFQTCRNFNKTVISCFNILWNNLALQNFTVINTKLWPLKPIESERLALDENYV